MMAALSTGTQAGGDGHICLGEDMTINVPCLSKKKNGITQVHKIGRKEYIYEGKENGALHEHHSPDRTSTKYATEVPVQQSGNTGQSTRHVVHEQRR
jgi:hypothetical protein